MLIECNSLFPFFTLLIYEIYIEFICLLYLFILSVYIYLFYHL